MPAETLVPRARRHFETPEGRAEERNRNEHLWVLVTQIQGGAGDHRDPFGELYRLTHPSVFFFLRSRVALHVAEDLAADVYVRAFKGIGRLRRESGSPTAWLITIARNLLLDFFKKADTRLTTPSPITDVFARTPEGRPQHLEAVDQTAIDTETLHTFVAVYGAMTRLTCEQREALTLRYLNGWSTEEVAADLGKNVNSVKALVYRATRTLQRDRAVVALAEVAA